MLVLNDDVVVAHTLLCFSAADTILHQALDLGDVVDNELGEVGEAGCYSWGAEDKEVNFKTFPIVEELLPGAELQLPLASDLPTH